MQRDLDHLYSYLFATGYFSQNGSSAIFNVFVLFNRGKMDARACEQETPESNACMWGCLNMNLFFNAADRTANRTGLPEVDGREPMAHSEDDGRNGRDRKAHERRS
jgi:hypothetical protein